MACRDPISKKMHQEPFRLRCRRTTLLAPRRSVAAGSPRRALPAVPGFTLIEVLVGLALIGILTLVGLPYTMETIRRVDFQNAVNCSANLMRVARLQAIRANANATVSLDGRLLLVDSGQAVQPSCQLPAVVDSVTVDGWTGSGQEAVFLPNGTAIDEGAFRFADKRGNLLEVRLAPAAIGRVEVRKFNGLDWVGRDQGGWKWH